MFEESKNDKYSIRVVKENDEYKAYVEEIPTICAYGKTPAEAWARCVKLIV